MQEIWVQSLGWEDPLEKEMATHSSILAWRIPWTGQPGGLQSMGSQESDTTERLSFFFLPPIIPTPGRRAKASPTGDGEMNHRRQPKDPSYPLGRYLLKVCSVLGPPATASHFTLSLQAQRGEVMELASSMNCNHELDQSETPKHAPSSTHQSSSPPQMIDLSESAGSPHVSFQWH